jgi:hypothetical protein
MDGIGSAAPVAVARMSGASSCPSGAVYARERRSGWIEEGRRYCILRTSTTSESGAIVPFQTS